MAELLPPLLQNYVQFDLALAKLRELDDPELANSEGCVASLGTTFFLGVFEPGALTTRDLTPETWKTWFVSNKTKPSVRSAYELRNFLGLENANSLVQRFDRYVAGGSKDARLGRNATLERALFAWGEYARALIAANGGATSFFAIQSLHEVQDVRRKGGQWSAAGPAHDPESFIQRVLALDSDRYLQVLAGPVGLLWALWVIADRGTHDTLGRVASLMQPKSKTAEEQNRRRDSALFIDLNTHVGMFDGYPYPFGFADDAVRDLDQKAEPKAPWPNALLVRLSEQIEEERWSPPVLVATRSDLFADVRDPLDTRRRGLQRVGPVVTVSEASTAFATYYVDRKLRRASDASAAEPLHVVYEQKSYAEQVVQALGGAKLEAVRRAEFLTSCFGREVGLDEASDSGGILVMSYFPADVLVAADDRFTRVDEFELANMTRTRARSLQYVLPGTVLVGGLALSGQPNMRSLVTAFAKQLHLLVQLVNALRPKFDILRPEFDELTDPELRERAAEKIAYACRTAASAHPLVSEHAVVPPEWIETWLRTTSKRMVDVLLPDSDCTERARAHAAIDQYAWARLLEFAGATSVYVSSELF